MVPSGPRATSMGMFSSTLIAIFINGYQPSRTGWKGAAAGKRDKIFAANALDARGHGLDGTVFDLDRGEAVEKAGSAIFVLFGHAVAVGVEGHVKRVGEPNVVERQHLAGQIVGGKWLIGQCGVAWRGQRVEVAQVEVGGVEGTAVWRQLHKGHARANR